MSPALCAILIGSSALFLLVALMVHWINSSRKKEASSRIDGLPINGRVLRIFLFVQLFVCVWTVIAIHEMFPGMSIPDAISAYDHSLKFYSLVQDGVSFGEMSANVSLPGMLSFLRSFCLAAAYFNVYLLSQVLASRDKDNILLPALNFVVTFALATETGSRGGITYLICFALCYLLVRRRITGKKAVFTAGTVLVVSVSVVVGLLLFRFMAIGRTPVEGLFDYIAIYVGAEIPNLDAAISTYAFPTSSFFGQHTLATSITWLAGIFNIADLSTVPNTLYFQYRNNIGMGNVYTLLYDFLQDGGVFGVVVFVSIMAATSQYVYERVNGKDGGYFDVWAIVYSYCAAALLMSFFSDRYYSDFLNLVFAKNMVYILLMRYAYLQCGNKKSRRSRAVRISEGSAR